MAARGPTGSSCLYVGPFCLDMRAGLLSRDGTPIALRPKTFAVLCHLVERAGALVTKHELLDAVWPDVVVSEDMPRLCVGELRAALGDARDRPAFIATVPRRGYRFVARVAARAPRDAEAASGFGDPPLHPGPRLVGRDGELRELDGWLDAVRSGRCRVGFVCGEVGIGKTALIGAFLDRVRRHRAPGSGPGRPAIRIAYGQCVEQYGAGEAYLPVLDALAHLCQGPDGARARATLRRRGPAWLLRAAGLLAQVEGDDTAPAAGGTREHALHILAGTLAALAREAPLVLVLEDLHWADYSTVDLLNRLARRRDAVPLLVLGTVRTGDGRTRRHPVLAVLRELFARGQSGTLRLDSLSEADVGRCLAPRLPGALAPRLVRYLFERTEGNPFFLLALTDDLVARGLLTRDGREWRLGADAAALEAGVPDGLRAIVEPLLGRASAAERRLLEAASVAGMEFAAHALTTVLRAREGIDAVEEAEARCEAVTSRHDLLRRAGEVAWPNGQSSARYAFRHALYRQAVYEQIPAARRRRLHQTVGERLEAGYGARTIEVAAELAAHFARSGDDERTARYRVEAAHAARMRFADREVCLHLEAALEHLGRLPDTQPRAFQEMACLRDLGVALFASRGYGDPAVSRVFARMQAVAGRWGGGAGLFVAKSGRYFFHVMRAEFAAALEIARDLAAFGDETGVPILGSAGHSMLGTVLYNLGDLAGARTHLELARDRFDPHAPGFGMDMAVIHRSHLAFTLALLGRLVPAVEACRDALARARELGDPLHRAYAHHLAAHFYALLGAPEDARRHADETVRIATEYGFPAHLAGATIVRGWTRAVVERDATYVATMRQALRDYEATQQRVGKSVFCVLIAQAALCGGDTAGALEAIEVGSAHASETGEAQHVSALERLRGQCAARADRRTAAGHFRAALAAASRQHAKLPELRAAVALYRLERGRRRPGGTAAGARAHLEEVIASLPDGFGGEDAKRARRLVAAG